MSAAKHGLLRDEFVARRALPIFRGVGPVGARCRGIIPWRPNRKPEKSLPDGKDETASQIASPRRAVYVQVANDDDRRILEVVKVIGSQ